MGIIYILQKDVPGIGRLTKIGMTIRSGEDRANEYGGGNWDVVAEVGVAVDDVSELKELERRIHERLDDCRCHPAVGFGLTEVFTCSPEEAVAVARAEIGSKATDEDQVERLRKRTNRAVERKIMQTHAHELARLHMGKWEQVSRIDFVRDSNVPIGAPAREIAEYRIHTSALEALDRIGAEAATFRAMVSADIDKLKGRWVELERQIENTRNEAERVARQRAEETARNAEIAARATRKQHEAAEMERARKERETEEKAWQRDLQRRLSAPTSRIVESRRYFWVCTATACMMPVVALLLMQESELRFETIGLLSVGVLLCAAGAIGLHVRQRRAEQHAERVRREFEAQRLEHNGS